MLLENRLEANISQMAEQLTDHGARDGNQLNHLLLQTNVMVHSGFQLIASAVPLKAAEMDKAADDSARSIIQRDWSHITRLLHQLQITLAKWPVVQSMIRPQVGSRRRALFENSTKLPDIVRTRERLSDRLFAELHTLLNPLAQDDEAQEHGCYPDIPLAQSLFLKEVHAAKRILMTTRRGKAIKFLDVGCGAGLKVMSAAEYFDMCVGLEYDLGYVQVAKNLMQRLAHNRCTVLHGDALSFEDYRNYDVIYFFRPIRDSAILAQMETKIVEEAKPGALLIAPYRMFEDRHHDYNCVHVDGHIFLVGGTQKEAKRIRKAAEQTGPDVPLADNTNVPMIWDPLIEVCKLNGFDATLSNRHYNEDVNS